MELRKTTRRRINIRPAIQPACVFGPVQEDLRHLLDLARLLENDNRLFRQDIDEKLSLLNLRPAYRRDDLDMSDLQTRPLRIQVDLANALNRIPEELNPHRFSARL